MQQLADGFQGVLLTDCMPLVNCQHESLVKGDSRSVSIAAASILAKVVRDHIMFGYDVLYPQYGYSQHKGYPTKLHLANIESYGLLDIYRQSYKPVAEYRKRQLLAKLDI
jgi:ribonuclease HII